MLATYKLFSGEPAVLKLLGLNKCGKWRKPIDTPFLLQMWLQQTSLKYWVEANIFEVEIPEQ